MPARLYVTALDLGSTVAEVVRRLAHRERVTAWSGAWSRGAVVTCDPVPTPLAFPAVPDVAVADVEGVGPEAIGGGWFGYLSFPARAGSPFPRVSMAFYRDVLRFDGTRWWYEALLDVGFGRADADARVLALLADLAVPAVRDPARLEVTGVPDATAHVVAVERCVQAIRRGEVYQANIACHIDARLHGTVHDAWAQVVEASAPARAALVADPAGAAVCASPELFLQRDGRTVHTAPIKGTRPRTGVADEAERSRLAASAKDSAENVMIVDLMRNDLSRVCATGSVTVPALLEVEPHPGVWHLVSTVRGELPAGVDDAALLAATFPPGSVTGAPKIRAVELIEQLEPGPRGLFTGALGYVSPVAGMELAVAIRTIEVDGDGRTRLGVGGGVTVDSTPVEEWAECLTKAAPVLGALGAPALHPGVAWTGSGLARPECGLFETIHAVDGRPRRLADHARRLLASYTECYGMPLTVDVAAEVAAAAAGRVGHWRLRVDVRPESPDRLAVSAAPFTAPVPPDAQPGVVLVPHRLGPAGAERHKFADRSWIVEIEDRLDATQAALLVDDRDAVLESTRSSVFVVRDGVPRTPPLDGRILPGTGRRAVLDELDTAGLPYELVAPTLAELAAADGIFLVNALRGVQWVRAVAGTTWDRPDPVTLRIAALLDS